MSPFGTLFVFGVSVTNALPNFQPLRVNQVNQTYVQKYK